MVELRVLSKSNIDQLLRKEGAHEEIITLMADTFNIVTNEQTKVQTPQRIGVKTDSHQVLFMPARLRNVTTVKIVSVPTTNSQLGLPATVLVLDYATGNVESILNAGALTAIRTAAGSAVATQYFAKDDSKNLVVFGAGAQARAHVEMMITVRPTLQRIAIWNRSEERRDRLINELKDAYPERDFVAVTTSGLKDEVRQADIVCTCTNSKEPVLMGKWLKNGVHLNCVGSYTMDMHEVDAETVQRAEFIVVDSIEACSCEAGELVKSSMPTRWVEIGSIVKNRDMIDHAPRKAITTLFKSVGVSAQDSAIANYLVERAKSDNLGVLVPF